MRLVAAVEAKRAAMALMERERDGHVEDEKA